MFVRCFLPGGYFASGDVVECAKAAEQLDAQVVLAFLDAAKGSGRGFDCFGDGTNAEVFGDTRGVQVGGDGLEELVEVRICGHNVLGLMSCF